MLCPKCGYYTDREDTVCPECGEIINTEGGAPEKGVEAIRQGKRARQAVMEAAARAAQESRRRKRSGASHATVELPPVRDDREETPDPAGVPVSEREILLDEDEDEGGIFERRRRPVYDERAAEEEQARISAQKMEHSRGRIKRFNWIKVGFVFFCLLVLLLVGGWLFLDKTDAGQKILARLGRDASSPALWAVGEEQMNSGDVEGAIASFEKAKKKDEAEDLPDVDGLLMLGSAYEAVGRIDDAAALYEEIYKDTPSRTEAYVNHIRILQNSNRPGDLAKAGELMKTAYKMTGDSSFQTQRRDFLPLPPKVDLTAALYEQKKNIRIWSDQGFDVYYTFDENAELPSGGTLVTTRVPLDEGIHSLRAVAVNGELVSDELRGTYKIIMPSPQTPQCNLAPGYFKTRQRVRLKPGKDNQNDDDITIYYTVDGSNPDADCPIYNGTPVLLPSGHTVILKAVAVNGYGKISNMLEVKYKIEAKPYPQTAWTLEETVDGLELNKTTMLTFQTTYGEGVQAKGYQNTDFETECRKLEYPWGYAVMTLNKKNWVLVELYFTDGLVFKAPRGTTVGDPDDFVVGKFKDLGQLESASGNRGLYALENGSDGKIWLQEDGSRIIRYRIRTEGHWYQLEYYVNQGGIVTAISYRYIPS